MNNIPPGKETFSKYEVEAMFNALCGIAACSTSCPCCQMLADIARGVLQPYRSKFFENEVERD